MDQRKLFHRLSRAAVLVAGLTLPSVARAHGGTWFPDQVIVEPGNPDHVLLRSDAWGVIATLDGGATWQWLCAEAYGGMSASPEHRGMAWLPGGTLLVAGGLNGLRRSDAALCDFGTVGSFENKGRCEGANCLVWDVARSYDAERAVVMLTQSYGGNPDASTAPTNLLWHSPDGGSTWDPSPKPLPESIPGAATTAALLPSSIAVAPTDPKTLYAAAQVGSGALRVALSSHDGGVTWAQATPLDSSGSTASLVPPSFRVQAVHPQNPATVFFLLDYADDSSADPGQDRLYVSTDGGATLALAFQATANLQGLAFSADGATVFLGGERDGLLRAKVADVATKSNAAFVQLDADGFCGLASTPEGLLAGHIDITVPLARRYSLGLSTDMGASFRARFHFCDVTLASCGTGTSAGAVCPGKFYGPSNFESDFLDPMYGRCPDVADAGVDAGARAPRADSGVGGPVVTVTGDAGHASTRERVSAGCGCSLPAQRPGSRAVGLLVLAAVLAGVRRRPRLK